ncbi:MAG: DMT family transporter [Afipia sp.]|nr:DMT family transporter [Afipia sp.]
MSKSYLLLSLTSLFWAGNVVLGRFVAGKIPPMTLSFIRWSAAFLIVLPFAWKYLRKDWPAIRKQIVLMMVLSFTGITTFNCLGYWSLQYTQALNALLLQSTGPLFVALFALILFGVRLTWAQTIGITISMMGVLVILLRGDIETLSGIQFNKGDIGYTTALIIFGLYSALAAKRPLIHPLSFLAFTTGCGALFIIPLIAWEIGNGEYMTVNATTMAALVYVAIFPSTLAYLFFNRGIELIGPNRAAPFFHLIPVFGSVLAIAFLGERPHLFHIAGYALVLTGVYIAARRASATSGGNPVEPAAPT